MIIKAVCPNCETNVAIECEGEEEVTVWMKQEFDERGDFEDDDNSEWDMAGGDRFGDFGVRRTGSYYCDACDFKFTEFKKIGGDDEGIEYLENKTKREALNAGGQQDLFKEGG